MSTRRAYAIRIAFSIALVAFAASIALLILYAFTAQ